MRILNKRQKNIIDIWFDENWKGVGSFLDVDNMPLDIYKKIEEINDHETIYQNINRYINDKIMDKLYL